MDGLKTIRTPHGQQVRVDFGNSVVARGQTANGHERGNENPQHADQHDDRLREVRIRNSQVSAQERVENNHADRNEQRPLEVNAGDHFQPAPTGNELGQHVQEHARKRDRCGHRPRPRRRVAVLQILNRGQRSEDLRQFAHAPAQNRQVEHTTADVTHRVPHAEVALRVAKRSRAEEHVAGHRRRLQPQRRHRRTQTAPTQQEALFADRAAPHGPHADRNHGDKVDDEECQFDAHRAPPSSGAAAPGVRPA